MVLIEYTICLLSLTFWLKIVNEEISIIDLQYSTNLGRTIFSPISDNCQQADQTHNNLLFASCSANHGAKEMEENRGKRRKMEEMEEIPWITITIFITAVTAFGFSFFGPELFGKQPIETTVCCTMKLNLKELNLQVTYKKLQHNLKNWEK